VHTLFFFIAIPGFVLTIDATIGGGYGIMWYAAIALLALTILMITLMRTLYMYLAPYNVSSKTSILLYIYQYATTLTVLGVFWSLIDPNNATDVDGLTTLGLCMTVMTTVTNVSMFTLFWPVNVNKEDPDKRKKEIEKQVRSRRNVNYNNMLLYCVALDIGCLSFFHRQPNPGHYFAIVGMLMFNAAVVAVSILIDLWKGFRSINNKNPEFGSGLPFLYVIIGSFVKFGFGCGYAAFRAPTVDRSDYVRYFQWAMWQVNMAGMILIIGTVLIPYLVYWLGIWLKDCLPSCCKCCKKLAEESRNEVRAVETGYTDIEAGVQKNKFKEFRDTPSSYHSLA